MTKHDIEFWVYVIALKLILVGLIIGYGYYVTM
jgi:hypothetical protein